MTNILIEIKFKIGILSAFIGFVIGLLFTDYQSIENSTDMGLSVGLALIFGIFGFSVLPVIFFEFSNSERKLSMLCGPIGISFVKLALKVFLSDGNISKTEIKSINSYMQKEFGKSIASPLNDFISENMNFSEALDSITRPINEIKLSGRIDILYRLFSMAASERIFNSKEEIVLKNIAKGLRIGQSRFEMIKMKVLKNKGYYTESDQSHSYKKQTENFNILDQLLRMAYNPFNVLGIEQGASNQEVKKAYRIMVKKYHPDKLRHQDSELKNPDSAMIFQINEAYEAIKKMRGIK